MNESSNDATNTFNYAKKGSKNYAKIIASGTKVSSRGLLSLMGVRGYTKGSLGIKKIRKTRLCDLDRHIKRKLTPCFRIIILKAAFAFLPDEP